ncbi:hypothetical protein K2X05_11225 [bacterium]|nr:hypothetical protein [bacterium]
MVAIWVIIGLVVSAICVSALGAAFSVVGLGALFSGAMVAVWAMAGSLEFSKFVLAAYLHQRWRDLNVIFRSYLVFAVVVLSLITSMGIFGFLSDAYQSSSHAIEEVNIKIANLRSQQKLNEAEISRLNKSIDEIPDSRVSKKIKARAEAEPRISALTKESEEIDRKIGTANLQLHEIKKKIGPLVYIARATNKDIDTIVTYLILVFVSVFDPLAICLVIATSEAIDARRRWKLNPPQQQDVHPMAQAPVVAPSPVPVTAATSALVEEMPVVQAVHPPSFLNATDEIIEMKYVDDDKKSG